MNGGIHTERKVGNRDRERNRIGSGESEHESLLVHENTPKYTRNNQLNLCSEQGKLAYCIQLIFYALHLVRSAQICSIYNENITYSSW